jgi:hypothetical protein
LDQGAGGTEQSSGVGLCGPQRAAGALAFFLHGIDSDNGSGFINADLLQYCQQERLTFTRSRPYRKNDNCYVEQKNYTMVRRQVGYQRLAGQEQLALVNKLLSTADEAEVQRTAWQSGKEDF